MHLFTNDRRKWGWGALLAALLFTATRWRGLPIAPKYIPWLFLAGVGLFGLWLLLLNLLWFLGSASTRRSGIAWLIGTPVILGVTGLWVGGTFDLGCIIQWGSPGGLVGLVGGLVGLVAGFVLGWVMALSGRGSGADEKRDHDSE